MWLSWPNSFRRLRSLNGVRLPSKQKLLAAVSLAIGSSVCAADVLDQAANAAGIRSFTSNVTSGCTMKYEYTANVDTEWQLFSADKEALGQLLYGVYSSTHNVYGDLAKTVDRGQTVVHLPPATTSGSASPSRKTPDRGDGTVPRQVTMGVDTLGRANEYVSSFRLFSPALQFKYVAGWFECSRGAMYDMENAASNRKEHLDRALTLISDNDAELQERGLRVLQKEADDVYLWSLPEPQRRQIADVAYRVYKNEFSAAAEFVARLHTPDSPTGSIGVGSLGAEMLARIHDPRAVEAYMAYVTMDEPIFGSKAALSSLVRILPRPTQVISQLEEILQAHEFTQPARGQFEFDEMLVFAIAALGLDEARPVLERYVRSKNEHIAATAEKAIDALNNASRRHPN